MRNLSIKWWFEKCGTPVMFPPPAALGVHRTSNLCKNTLRGISTEWHGGGILTARMNDTARGVWPRCNRGHQGLWSLWWGFIDVRYFPNCLNLRASGAVESQEEQQKNCDKTNNSVPYLPMDHWFCGQFRGLSGLKSKTRLLASAHVEYKWNYRCNLNTSLTFCMLTCVLYGCGKTDL